MGRRADKRPGQRAAGPMSRRADGSTGRWEHGLETPIGRWAPGRLADGCMEGPADARADGSWGGRATGAQAVGEQAGGLRRGPTRTGTCRLQDAGSKQGSWSLAPGRGI